MLVTAEEMLKKAKAGKYAVGQFNINNLELDARQSLQPHRNCRAPGYPWCFRGCW